jgi:hypothetical protein
MRDDDKAKIAPERFERGMTPRVLWLSMVKALRSVRRKNKKKLRSGSNGNVP